MSAAAGATDTYKKLRAAARWLVCTVWVTTLCSCAGSFESEPLVEYSTDVVVSGSRPHIVNRQLGPGVYLVEIRERDVDLRVTVDAGEHHIELADALLRHGVHRAVVRLESATRIRLTLDSVDVRSWKGAAALRILRWPKSSADGAPDQSLIGFELLGKAGELLARDTPDSWRAGLEPMREAARRFQAARDPQSMAEAEYQRGQVELDLLFDYDAGRRTAESALAHFHDAGDEIGAHRASMLLAQHEFAAAAGMGPQVPRAEQRRLLNEAAGRAKEAWEFFQSSDLQSDALQAMAVSRTGDEVMGRAGNGAALYESMRRQAHARGDRLFEVIAIRRLGNIAQRGGDAPRAAALYESALPHVERERNPGLYADLLSDLGTALISRGEFDRALSLHTEALEVFSARRDESRMARELAALATIQFRSGDPGRALVTIENSLPLYAKSRDQDGQVSALRLAGNIAAELGRHAQATEYLRGAEARDLNGITIDNTRVLLAGELRVLGDFTAAEKMLGQALLSADESTRADALAERARLRQREHRNVEALADLRGADGIYARLQLDFSRIDSSSALALALLVAGDSAGAAAAADTAIAMERRIREKAASPETRARILAASYAAYEARIEVDLAAAPKDPGAEWRAFQTAEAIRARSLSDRLSHGERGATGGHDRRDAGREIGASLAAVQAALPVDTAVLAYFVGDQRSHGWLLTRGDLRHLVLPGRRALDELVDSFIEQQRAGGRPASPADFAPLLGNLLVGIAAKRLLVLPDGPLNGLPFAALPLPRGQPREQLVDRFVIATAPSLALALRPGAQRGGGTLVAIVSDPVYTPDDRRLSAAAGAASRYRGANDNSERLARLPYSAIEARSVARAFDAARVIELAGFDASVRRVIELPSRDLRVLHFATHAVARRDAPGQSALFLSEFAADGSPLAADRLTADDITHSGLRADVVVLSGCATGDGSELRGEGVLGLTYGFLANGSDVVVASLWPVEDALTARFMEEFYVAYRSSGRAADALRLAQLRTRGASRASVWSSFVVRANTLP